MPWAEPPDACYNLTNGVTTGQFLQFCRAIGCTDAMITANVYSSGNPQCGKWLTPLDAANWVRHTNINGDFPVKYWELGNEIQALTDTVHYIPKIQAWSQTMKAVDPDHQDRRSSRNPAYSRPGRNHQQRADYRRTANDIDFLIPHPYRIPCLTSRPMRVGAWMLSTLHRPGYNAML